jgi:glycyl-tRNA synthetase beta chain
MVGEFPELQGVMGAYYAAADGEPGDVSAGIREHYMPRGAGDALPADARRHGGRARGSLDTLAGIFAIGQKPSGTKDPFGLRRAAIGVLRLCIEQRLDLDLPALIDRRRRGPAGEERDRRRRCPAVRAGAAARLLSGRRPGRGEGAATDITGENSTPCSRPRRARPLDIDARLHALAAFLARPEAASLAAANKRIANILKKSEGSATGTGAIDAALFREPAEKALGRRSSRASRAGAGARSPVATTPARSANSPHSSPKSTSSSMP